MEGGWERGILYVMEVERKEVTKLIRREQCGGRSEVGRKGGMWRMEGGWEKGRDVADGGRLGERDDGGKECRREGAM